MSENTRTDNELRIRFMQINAETRRDLNEFWPNVTPHLPEIMTGFYAHVTQHQPLAKLIGNDVPRLKKAQGSHWERLFSGRFDDAYFEGVKRIGLIHHKIGLEPRWYIAGYNFVLSSLTDIATRTHRWAPKKLAATLRAINCAVLLDMDIAISVYQEALLEERARRSKKLDILMNEFSDKSGDLVHAVAAAATELQATATEMSGIANKTTDQSAAVAVAAE